jgi:hypothetical protein
MVATGDLHYYFDARVVLDWFGVLLLAKTSDHVGLSAGQSINISRSKTSPGIFYTKMFTSMLSCHDYFCDFIARQKEREINAKLSDRPLYPLTRDLMQTRYFLHYCSFRRFDQFGEKFDPCGRHFQSCCC